MAILIISLRCRRLLLLLLKAQVRAELICTHTHVYIFQRTQAARTNPIHLTRWPFWLMQLTVYAAAANPLRAWFGLYNVACFHLKHFMPGGGVYRRDCLVSTVRSTLHPAAASRRISTRKTQTESTGAHSKNAAAADTLVYMLHRITRVEIWERERERKQPPNEHSPPPPATPVTHSGFDQNFSLHFAQALISVVCRVV